MSPGNCGQEARYLPEKAKNTWERIKNSVFGMETAQQGGREAGPL